MSFYHDLIAFILEFQFLVTDDNNCTWALKLQVSHDTHEWDNTNQIKGPKVIMLCQL